MRNLKRVLALALALVMVIGMMVIGSSAASYSDASAIDSKYAEAVDVLTGMGVFKGTGAGFAPKAVLTRAEASALIYRVITGDVKDAQTVNYKYSTFEDVAADAWYTGYITYASNGGYIKGYEGKAMPNDTVTGIQVMAIMLRAAGYGQNGEYEGEGWMDNILTDAKELGITGTIATSTLMAGATREVVAQLIFNAITKVGMVTYTPALGYLAVDFTDTNWRGTTTLGKKVFGLTCGYGAIVGNQATGQDVTMINLLDADDTRYEYDYEVSEDVYAEDFAIETGLDMFGHAVKVWYRNDANLYNYKVGAQVYAMYDETIKSAIVTELTDAAVKAAGFSLYNYGAGPWNDPYVKYSDAYNRFDTGLEKDYPIYVLIANDGYGVDAVIGVDAKIDTLLAVNNFLAKPNALFEVSGLVEQANVKNFADAALGDIVIMEYVEGTTYGGSYYMLDTLNNTTTAAVAGFNRNTNDIILADGSALSISPLADTGILATTTLPQLVKGATYTFVLDNNGCYLFYFQSTPSAHFLATWMYYTMTGDLHDMYNYYIMGVNAAGETVKYEVDYKTYDKLLPHVYGQQLNTEGTSAKNTAVVDLTLTKGKYAGDVCDKVDHAFIGNTLTAGTELDVIKGAQVVNYSYLVDENTTFYFVTGNASDLKVESFTGTTALVGNGTDYTLPADAMISLSEIKNSVVATGNYHVDTVVVYGKYGANISDLTMMYVEAGDPATGMIDLAGNVEINAWINGEAVKVYVPANKYNGIKGWTANGGMFFKYDIVNGLYVPTGSGLTEDVNYDLDCATATTGTIATIQVTDGTNFYNVGANTKIVTLPGVTKATGVKVADYTNFAHLAEAVATDLSTVKSIEIDIALDGRGNVTTLYITNITLIEK